MLCQFSFFETFIVRILTRHAVSLNLLNLTQNLIIVSYVRPLQSIAFELVHRHWDYLWGP